MFETSRSTGNCVTREQLCQSYHHMRCTLMCVVHILNNWCGKYSFRRKRPVVCNMFGQHLPSTGWMDAVLHLSPVSRSNVTSYLTSCKWHVTISRNVRSRRRNDDLSNAATHMDPFHEKGNAIIWNTFRVAMSWEPVCRPPGLLCPSYTIRVYIVQKGGFETELRTHHKTCVCTRRLRWHVPPPDWWIGTNHTRMTREWALWWRRLSGGGWWLA